MEYSCYELSIKFHFALAFNIQPCTKNKTNKNKMIYLILMNLSQLEFFIYLLKFGKFYKCIKSSRIIISIYF